MAENPANVADDPGSLVNQTAPVADEESSVRPDKVRIGIEPCQMLVSRIGRELGFDRPQFRADLHERVDLALGACAEMEAVEGQVRVLQSREDLLLG